MPPPTSKRSLRRSIRAAILALAPAERADQEARLHARFAELPGLAAADTILLYAAAYPDEFATGPLLALVRARGQRLVLPRVDREQHRLILHAIDDPGRDLEISAGGIPEPTLASTIVEPRTINWVLVPGLGFDRRGFRLGRGGGYYDRLLPELRPDCPRWALALAPQLVAEVPVEPHDQALDGIATPGEQITISTRARASAG